LVGRKSGEKRQLRFHPTDRLPRKRGGSLPHLALGVQGAWRQIGHVSSMSWPEG
jgi:hypothetical protein